MNKAAVLSAAAALSKIAEIKQFGLAQDYNYLLKIEDVIKINEEATSATGVNLLETDKRLSIEDIVKYENYLDIIIRNSLSQKFSDGFLADELQLLNNSRPFSVNSFRGFTISRVSSLVKDSLNSIGIITPSIIPIAKSSNIVECIDEKQENFLTLSSLTIKSRKVFAIFHVIIGNHARSHKKPKSIEGSFESAKQVIELNAVSIAACFLVEPSNELLREDSLIHLFMQAILKYGKNTTIGNQTRKFFLKGVSSSLLIHPGDEIIIDDKLSNHMSGNMVLKTTPTGYEYHFVYNIAVDAMIRDYKRGHFLS